MRWFAMVAIAASFGLESNRLRADPMPANAAVAQVVTAHNRFAFRLLGEMGKADSLRNVVISPASAAFALGLVYAGARGATAEEMARCLELHGLERDSVNAGEGALIRSLQNAPSGVELKIATSLWAAKNVIFQPAFSALARDVHQAQVTALDLGSADAPRRINAWVRDKTQGKIDRMVDKLEDESALIILNAVYFNGAWLHEFDPKATRDGPFKLTSGIVGQRPMMTRKGDIAYLDDGGIEIVALPYLGQTMNFYVILPPEDMTITSLVRQLDAVQWDAWLQRLEPQEVKLTFPRFEISADMELDESLRALGMQQAFTDAANFSGMAPQLFVGSVRQKARIEVSERGTVAAAVTKVEMFTIGMVHTPVIMTVDRPFLYAIRDHRTGLILFLGIVADPGAVQ